MTSNLPADTSDREIAASRIFDAPRTLVWEVWTDSKHLERWWGPHDFTTSTAEFDFSPGGRWVHTMHGPDGTDYKNESVFTEIIIYEKIVFDHVSGPKFTATVRFEEQGEKTILNWHMLFETPEQLAHVIKTFKADEGLKQNLEKLDAYLTELAGERAG